ncbi:hypothetical protein C8F04DRAFT_1126281 [Mycena alexandri]|uniref:LysM domain-containing protein n=1 Tax=Mycena alexandri TaxID=1745969 RepID=A0AAD6WWN8_9AGAR|nr:hypothetical protein C8F04DRAFT_1126281 [Mycena alexandri]
MFARALTLLAIPFVAHASLASRGACNRRYTIQENDICDSISAANQVSTYQLATINAGYIDTGCTNLEPGASICLGYAGEDCTTTYVIVADDTCDAITDKFSISSSTLRTNNPQINAACDNIYIGEVLCVSSKVEVPPAPGSSKNSGSSENDDVPYCDEL